MTPRRTEPACRHTGRRNPPRTPQTDVPRFCPNCGVPLRHNLLGATCDRCGYLIAVTGQRFTRRKLSVMFAVSFTFVVVMVVIALSL